MLRPVGHNGSYTVVKPIGRGKYGVCYKAFKSDGHPVVLKRFYKNPTKGRFAPDDHEAVILSGLDHPAIPEFLGVLNEKAGYFFVLEYKNGMTLEQIIFKHRHRFCDDEIFNVGSQLLKIMSYIHSRNVIHGDLRLSNIIMDDNGHISLIDFGLARYTGEDGLDFDLDYSCFGNILLYLLYSAYPKRGKKIWYEELDLLPGQRAYLMRLLRLTEPFTSDTAVVEGFRKNFSIN
ncbi:protein kinase family protein [Catenibacillus scindens]|uniref:protein kinase family protein n=1 Tax=Catenibacillus scindens TaxID=673271 RepID=UPI00320B69CC